MWPQHLKDLISPSAGSGSQALLEALTDFTNMILEGKTPSFVRPFFFGTTLVALEKKDGGVRPIAVGCTFRRLLAKCAGRSVMEEMGALLAPRQLGYGIARGAEAAVHAGRIYIQSLTDGMVFVKLDFKNTFNSVRRDKMLKSVKELAPAILPFVHSTYSEPFLGKRHPSVL